MISELSNLQELIIFCLVKTQNVISMCVEPEYTSKLYDFATLKNPPFWGLSHR
jgi:hypothetical protein